MIELAGKIDIDLPGSSTSKLSYIRQFDYHKPNWCNYNYGHGVNALQVNVITKTKQKKVRHFLRVN